MLLSFRGSRAAGARRQGPGGLRLLAALGQPSCRSEGPRALNRSKFHLHIVHDGVTGHGSRGWGGGGFLTVNSKNWTTLFGPIWSVLQTPWSTHLFSRTLETATRVPLFSVQPQVKNCPADRPSVEMRGLGVSTLTAVKSLPGDVSTPREGIRPVSGLSCWLNHDLAAGTGSPRCVPTCALEEGHCPRQEEDLASLSRWGPLPSSPPGLGHQPSKVPCHTFTTGHESRTRTRGYMWTHRPCPAKRQVISATRKDNFYKYGCICTVTPRCLLNRY